MKTKIRKAFQRHAEEGSRAVRCKAIQEGKHVCQQDKKRLETSGQQQCEDYTRRFEASASEVVEGSLRPAAIPSEIRDARMANLIAWALVVVELTLALFFAFTFSINPVFVALVTSVAIFVVKGSLLMIWRSPERPQTTRRELRNLILIPSFILTIVSLAVLTFARGPLALLLFPFISVALGTLSLGICFLSAGLMAYAYSLNWSKKAEKLFNATSQEYAETVQLEDALLQMEHKLNPKAVPSISAGAANESALIVPLHFAPTAISRRHASVTKASVFNSLLVLVAAAWLTGCQNSSLTATGAEIVEPPATQSQPASAQLAIYVDWSLSGKDQALQQASQNAVQALPEIAEKYHVVRVTASHFGADGWDAEPITALPLPIFQLAAPNESEVLLGNVRADHEQKARVDYQADLRKSLAALTPEMLLPTNVSEPKCTDIQGVLNRITKTTQRQISIVITDGAENCASALQPVKVTQPLVIVLLSEKDTTQTLSHELYEQRRQQLAAAAPQAVIVPHFDAQLLEAVNQAVAKVKMK